MKKVILLFNGGNKKILFVKWVQLLKWNWKIKAIKGRKFVEGKNPVNWGYHNTTV